MKRLSLNPDDLVRKYLSGQSEYALAREYGVSRIPIRRILREQGITPRSYSAAGLIRASKMTPAERKAQASAAHLAATGRSKTFAEQCLAAQTRQENGSTISANERILAALLLERGLAVIHQQAIGPYNCDLGADPVAVEVFGGHWHWMGDHLSNTPKRFHYLLNAGWHILTIPVTNSSPLTPAVADYIVTFVEQARRHPTTRREYRVVWRAGEFVTTGSLDDDHITIEPPFTGSRDRVTGQYKTIPR